VSKVYEYLENPEHLGTLQQIETFIDKKNVEMD